MHSKSFGGKTLQLDAKFQISLENFCGKHVEIFLVPLKLDIYIYTLAPRVSLLVNLMFCFCHLYSMEEDLDLRDIPCEISF